MTQASNPVGLYLGKIQQELSTGHAQEHSYRPALKELFETITSLRVVNEPKGSAHGRPDFIFVRGDEYLLLPGDRLTFDDFEAFRRLMTCNSHFMPSIRGIKCDKKL